MLSYMQHVFHIVDNKKTLKNSFCIDLDLLKLGSFNSNHFGVRYNMADTITNIWKKIQKSALNTKPNDKSNANKKLKLSCKDFLFLIRNLSLDTIVLIINKPFSQGHMLDNHIFKSLLPNNSCRILCDHIYTLYFFNNL